MRVSDRIVIGDGVGHWVQQENGGFFRPGAVCIGLRNSADALIAGTIFDYFNGAAIYMSGAAKGRLTREFIRVFLDYPFNQLRVRVVLCLVAAGNDKSRRFVEHLGCTLHTTIPDADPSGALLLYTLRKTQCKWI